MDSSQFHLAFPVRDLAEAKSFYLDVIGCKLGRETSNHVDLDMFGNHVVAHIAPPDAFGSSVSDFDGHDVPVPHFGLNLVGAQWDALAERCIGQHANFREFPHKRLQGKTGEHRTLFVIDPSGNALEFKTFVDPNDVFKINPEDMHSSPTDEIVIRPMVEAEVFRVARKVPENLLADGSIDSVAAVELVNALQKAFGLALDDIQAEDLATVSSAVTYIAKKRA